MATYGARILSMVPSAHEADGDSAGRLASQVSPAVFLVLYFQCDFLQLIRPWPAWWTQGSVIKRYQEGSGSGPATENNKSSKQLVIKRLANKGNHMLADTY